MNFSRIKNKIKQRFYQPHKSKVFRSENLKVFTELEETLNSAMGGKSSKKKEDKAEDKKESRL